MKTIILGYESVDRRGKARLLAGPDLFADNPKQFSLGKFNNFFGDGIVAAELWTEGKRIQTWVQTLKPQTKPDRKGKLK